MQSVQYDDEVFFSIVNIHLRIYNIIINSIIHFY